MTTFRHVCTFLIAAYLSTQAVAGVDPVMAIQRSNAENFKDRAISACIATAYEGSPAAADAEVTKSVFIEWTYYDFEKANPAVDQLVEKYLRRDYTNPQEGYAGAEFKLLKCLDMFHSKELHDLMLRYVKNPKWIGDEPVKPRKKR